MGARADYEELFPTAGSLLTKKAKLDLVAAHSEDLMRVTVSVREGTISSTLLLKRLRSGSHKKAGRDHLHDIPMPFAGRLVERILDLDSSYGGPGCQVGMRMLTRCARISPGRVGVRAGGRAGVVRRVGRRAVRLICTG